MNNIEIEKNIIACSDIFNKNLIILKEYHPYFNIPEKYKLLKFDLNKNNLPCKIFLNDKWIHLHSQYNPENESQRLFEQNIKYRHNPILIYGFGFGYILKYIYKIDYEKYKKIIIMDTNPDLFITALHLLDFTAELKMSNLKIIIYNDLNTIIKNFYEITKNEKLNEMNFIIHKPSFNLIPKNFEKLKSLFNTVYANIETEKSFGGLMETNYKKNILKCNSDNSIKNFFNENKNKFDKGLLVGAGPSLDYSLNAIKKIRGSNSVLFCVDAAAKALIRNDIIPDYIVSVDAQSEIKNFFLNLELKNTRLIYSILAYYEIVELPFLKKFYFVPEEHFIIKKFNTQFDTEDYLQGGGSVSTYSLELIIKIRCSEIYFFGQDFSFPNYLNYSKYSRRFEQYISAINKFNSIETILFNSFQKNIIYFENIPTIDNLLKYKKEFEYLINKYNEIKYFNVNSRGLKIYGTTNIEL